MAINLKGKIVIITGAAGGIGSATARLLAGEGAVLVLTDIKKEGLEALAAELAGTGAKVLTHVHDVRDPASWQVLTDRVRSELGGIDILINNAGVVHPGAAEELAPEKLLQQIQVNLIGTINGCRAALRVMKPQGRGKIVNVASLGGIVPMSGEAIYSATKAGIRYYTLSLAAELHGSPIGVAVVCPDSVETPQLAYEMQHDEAVLSFIGTAMKPEKVAKGIHRAIRKSKPEILVPGGFGSLYRFAMAFPRLYYVFYPMLKKTGGKNILKRRRKAALKG
ncbi:MAG: SDR family NAD(P)-dependent oxidoreductase [Acidobacteriota bacterium]|nr:SDR family NAD(P)-dependent oxidoreductase [Acidobacteriota bacterium]